MEIIYTLRTTGYEPGKRYANARFFDQPRNSVTRVVLDQDFPKIEAAYAAVGVEIVKPWLEPAAPVAEAALSEPIPDDWRDLPWSKPAKPDGPTLRGLVKAIGATAINRQQAIEAIEAELRRRADG